jgi:hypothetical protein
MIFVLFAPFGIDPGRLQMTVCLFAYPNVLPSRWNRQRSYPVQLGGVFDPPAFDIVISKIVAPFFPRNSPPESLDT